MKIHTFLLAVVLAVFVSSCSTGTKVTFMGAPGTEIHTSGSGEYIGTIPASGTLKSKISDNKLYPLLIATDPTTHQNIPFAMDMTRRKGSGIGRGLGIMLGSWAVAGGLIAAAPENTTVSLAVGLPIGVIGEVWGIVDMCCTPSKAAYLYKFKYLPQQNCNTDVSFTQPQITVMPVDVQVPATQRRRPDRVSVSADNSEPMPLVTRPVGGDKAKKVAGEYVGRGLITLNGEEVEQLRGITVRLTRVSANKLSVELIESDGNSFFGSPLAYTIQVRPGAQKGTTMLVQDQVSNSTITVDKNGHLEFYNPSLEIDGASYSLTVSAELQ